MHELGIARNIIAIGGEAAQGRQVVRVTLEVGKLSGVMAEAIAFCFEAAAKGTKLDGAVLDIHSIDGHARCLACGGNSRRWHCSRRVLAAPAAPCCCGARN